MQAQRSGNVKDNLDNLTIGNQKNCTAAYMRGSVVPCVPLPGECEGRVVLDGGVAAQVGRRADRLRVHLVAAVDGRNPDPDM